MFGLCGCFVQGLAIISIGGLGMHYQVVFIIYCVFVCYSYFHNSFGDKYAAAVGIGGADLFVCCII